MPLRRPPAGIPGLARLLLPLTALALAVGLAGPALAGSPGGQAEARPASSAAPAAGATPSESSPSKPLALAYFYIWFNTASWAHAKTDLPALGPYVSTDPAVISQQVTWARQSGVDAFLVSWKSTPSLNLALSELVAECHRQSLKLVLVYEGLDVQRNPIPTETVRSDLLSFVNEYGSDPAFELFGKPAIVWAGTWRFSDADIASVRELIDAPNRALLLGSEKSAADYTPRATLFDGDAYYWSSADPLLTPGYPGRLNDLGKAVHASGGLWLAPAAAGFDATLNGGTAVVARRDGQTLTTAWADALASGADAVALISWNEYTENSYVEPSKAYGLQYLRVLASLTGASGPTEAVIPALQTTSPASATPASTRSTAQESRGGSSGVPGVTGTGSASGRGSAADALLSFIVAAMILAVLVLVGRRIRTKAVPGAPAPADGTGPHARGPLT
jgi:hypothetical protein